MHHLRPPVAHEASGGPIPCRSGYKGLNYSDPFGLTPWGFYSWLFDLLDKHRKLTEKFRAAHPTFVHIAEGLEFAASIDAGLGGGGGRICPLHHVATNKNWISARGGGPFSPKFAALFEKAGMSLDDGPVVRVFGHRGPHPEYNKAVYDRFLNVTDGLEGDAFTAAFRQELDAIANESATSGTELNRLLQRKQE